MSVRLDNIMEDTVCYCSNVSGAAILAAVEAGAGTLADVRKATGACTLARCAELSPRKRCCSTEIVGILNAAGIRERT